MATGIPIKSLFSTEIYYAPLGNKITRRLNQELLLETRQIQKADEQGQRWSEKNYVGGYTSYGSLDQLHKLSTTFNDLRQAIDKHVEKFVDWLEFDLRGNKYWMSSCWVNIMPALAHHSFHIHPLSFISGTYYLRVPPGASCIKFEDPRLGCFMGAPPRKVRCQAFHRPFYELQPKEGYVVLFESWLRHEVPAHLCPEERISISFNYNWS